MATFIIDDKEFDLKITYEAIERLNKAFEGGAYEVVGRALSNDIEAFPTIVHAALIHTGEKFTKKKIDEVVKQMYVDETISFDYIQQVYKEVIMDSFFYKPTFQRMMKANPEMKEMYKQMYG